MKAHFSSWLLSVLIAASLTHSVRGQTTEFTYQGKLANNGNSPSGPYDFKFRLYDENGDLKGTECARPGVPVDKGLFTVHVDFGVDPFIFTGAQAPVERRWLEIDVKDASLPGAT